MAAIDTVCAPKGAVSAESPPVTVSALRTGGSYPAARRTAKPGRFCEAIVTR